ncbi:MAG: tRNA (N(6)-L-threonylcarbamoyladenosine(37)-C(2))-methylthiotransferase MtaB [Desulfobacterales bacterium]|jgi:threonylcarbamoyladenosine tRNA methylthiotransferase MtaB
MPKFIIKTLGCKVNQYESEAIGKELQASGWFAVQTEELSDLCIINTCTVTQKAAMQSRQAVRQAIRANPGARIVVTGCYAQTESDELKKIKGVHCVIGHAGKHKIGSVFQSLEEAKETASISVCSDMRDEIHFKQFSEAVYGTRTRPFLKIQDGCSAFCTYCIVPLARGPSRSMALNDVLEHIRELGNAGYHEVVLTGVHLGNYGIDLIPKTSLYEVLCRIDESKLVHRVRLSSIEPLELSNEILKLVSSSRRFCRHFHIPLQSGDDDILKKMRRPYTRNYFHDLVLKINSCIPDAAIGVDVLVGFPGETVEAFENTYNLIRVLPVAYLHVFPFSSRPGTPANSFADKIPPDVIKARCERMRNLGEEKRLKFYQGFVGQTLEVLIEETRDNETGFLKGITSNYIPVLVDAPDDHQNTIVPVKIEKFTEINRPLGTIRPQT